MNKYDLSNGRCECGKLKFMNVSLARKFNNEQRIYLCPISQTYHLTNKESWKKGYNPSAGKFRPDKLLKELQMSQKIAVAAVEYMQELYEKNGEYKVSSGMVWTVLVKQFPTLGKQTLYNALNTLKRNKIVVNLDEPVPNQKGAFYFALASVLDKVTEPKPEEAKPPVAKEEVKPVSTAPKSAVKLPTQVAANPFDKVSSQLGELLTKVDGLTKGYTQVVEYQNIQRQAMESIAGYEAPKNTEIIDLLKVVQDEQRSVLTAVKYPEVSLDNDELKQIRNTINDEIAVLLTALTSTLTAPNGKYIESMRALIAGENAHQTTNIREHLVSNLHGVVSAIEALVQVPETVSNSDDYKEGIKEGIRIAIEMGLQIPGK